MRFPEPLSVKEIASRIDAEIIGDDQQWAHGINEIHKVQPGDITFVDIEKYYQKSLSSAASIILINKQVDCPPGKTLLVVTDPFKAYESIIKRYRSRDPLFSDVHPSAVVHPSAIIEPNVMIGKHVKIGADCYIQGHCYIGNYTTIGARTIIQAGTIVGTDAFYFKERSEGFEKWTSAGEVIIEEDVFIGAGCTINKGVSGATVIGKGSKLDSQVHIGHGVVLGQHCLLAGQVGVGGKTIIGNHVKIYGQAGIANNLVIGDHAKILAKTGVVKDLEGGKSYFGMPAEEARTKFMQLVALRKLIEK